jgi:hypothetical protein
MLRPPDAALLVNGPQGALADPRAALELQRTVDNRATARTVRIQVDTNNVLRIREAAAYDGPSAPIHRLLCGGDVAGNEKMPCDLR